MPAATVTRTATAAVRRPGFFMQVRRMGRTFEHNPYERLSVTMKHARPDYAKQVAWTATKFVTYVPLFGAMLTWPALAKWAVDGQIGRL
ncbi:hypothetical protein J3F83DRAFT_716269 [Trichoderma novae-zelandiae]